MNTQSPTFPTPVRVAIIFESGRQPVPQWFDYQGQKVPITSINYRWQSFLGSASINHYSVSTEHPSLLLCELHHNTQTNVWTLDPK